MCRPVCGRILTLGPKFRDAFCDALPNENEHEIYDRRNGVKDHPRANFHVVEERIRQARSDRPDGFSIQWVQHQFDSCRVDDTRDDRGVENCF